MKALEIMSALAQPTRLAVFRTLVSAPPDGMAAGAIAEALGSLASTMSAHLAILQRAGVVSSVKSGRSVVYKAKPKAVTELAAFLTAVADEV